MFEGSTDSPYSYWDIFVAPFLRDGHMIVGACVFYFVVQFFFLWLMPRVSHNYTKLSKEDKRQFAVRMVSIVNGFIMFGSASVFMDQLRKNGWRLHNNHYEPVPEYRPFRLFIVGYFLWDVIVCIAYRWEALFIIHGVVALFGTYFLAFPFSDQYGSYYTGMFEMTNPLIHSAACLKLLNIHRTLASVIEYIFAFGFFCIRFVGGTIVTASWYLDMIPRLWRGSGHSHATIIGCLAVIAVVMVLQYVWMLEIFKLATGWGKRKEHTAAPEDPVQGASPKIRKSPTTTTAKSEFSKKMKK